MCVVVPDEFLAKVAAARQADEMDRLERLSQLRDEDRARLANQRLQREKVKICLHDTIGYDKVEVLGPDLRNI